MITVTSKKPIKDEDETEITVYGYTEGEDGMPKVQTLAEVKKEIAAETGIANSDMNFTSMTVEQLDTQLTKFIDAVKVIKKKMINGQHYLEIPGVEKPIITKQGTAWLAAATNMTVVVEEMKEIIKPEIDLILYKHKATCSWGDTRSVSAEGSANSQEYNQKRKYEDERSQKTVYDTINDVLQMSQKRARSQAIREMIAMTDIFDTNEDNPIANNRKQMGIYTLFYKHFMKHAPKAPSKRKLKNGKFKQFNEKEKLNWKKDYLKSKYFTPKLLDLGMPTFKNWGIKDVEYLTENIPKWPAQMIELSDYDKKLIEQTKETKETKNGKTN